MGVLHTPPTPHPLAARPEEGCARTLFWAAPASTVGPTNAAIGKRLGVPESSGRPGLMHVRGGRGTRASVSLTPRAPTIRARSSPELVTVRQEVAALTCSFGAGGSGSAAEADDGNSRASQAETSPLGV